MKSLNTVTLIGNLGKAPEMRYTPDGKAVTSFSLATSRKWKDQKSGNLVEDTQWHNIVTWGSSAEACNKSLEKGSAVCVVGRLNYREWMKDDVKHSRTEIIATDVIFLDKKAAGAVVDAADADAAPDDLPF